MHVFHFPRNIHICSTPAVCTGFVTGWLVPQKFVTSEIETNVRARGKYRLTYQHNSNNNNNEYLERLTRTGPKRLHVLYKYILSKFNAYNINAHTHARTHRDRTHTRTYARTNARTHARTHYNNSNTHDSHFQYN